MKLKTINKLFIVSIMVNIAVGALNIYLFKLYKSPNIKAILLYLGICFINMILCIALDIKERRINNVRR